MTTAHCCAADREFDPKIARRELKRYRKRGPVSPTKEMLELVTPRLPAEATLLDIGGGVGMIHHELLDRGARSAVQVDASSAYLAMSEEESKRRGHEGRVTFRHADFRSVASEIAPADVVTLDRVVCCDPDYESLLGLAAAHAKTALAFSYPRARWAARMFIGGFNAWRRLTGLPFRAHVHPPAAMAAVVERAGLKRQGSAQGFIWAVEVFVRAS
ncbi:MAG TPA: class I SAM-dependent methyltransferase [Candidatus Polarisedimenticolaceae bacterium]|nr:class I SAM-dependent methyltransferase [Candidatus Polarisedimenticolaceae bacterium]